ncbi:hypothetical protein BDR22DRAFT_789749, partial [Usnea florida]
IGFCPITHILALAYADGAIESGQEVLTPVLFWKVKAPHPLPVLLIRWKQEKQNTPLFPHTGRDGHTDSTKPMSYKMAHFSLQRLGRVAGFRYSIKSYCFRRWVANETNNALTSAVPSRILGHKGKETYEKHYQSKNASRNRTVQIIVLM